MLLVLTSSDLSAASDTDEPNSSLLLLWVEWLPFKRCCVRYTNSPEPMSMISFVKRVFTYVTKVLTQDPIGADLSLGPHVIPDRQNYLDTCNEEKLEET